MVDYVTYGTLEPENSCRVVKDENGADRLQRKSRTQQTIQTFSAYGDDGLHYLERLGVLEGGEAAGPQ
jgi:hypothetical protein